MSLTNTRAKLWTLGQRLHDARNERKGYSEPLFGGGGGAREIEHEGAGSRDAREGARERGARLGERRRGANRLRYARYLACEHARGRLRRDIARCAPRAAGGEDEIASRGEVGEGGFDGVDVVRRRRRSHRRCFPR